MDMDETGARADPDRWLAEVRADEAIRSRARERWLARQAGEEATLVGSVLTLAETGVALALELADGSTVRGRVLGVGRDVVALHQPNGDVAVVALPAVVVATGAGGGLDGGASVVHDHRLPTGRDTLADLLARWAGDRPSVEVRAGHRVVTGELAVVGDDVLVLRSPPPARTSVAVALAHVHAVVGTQPLPA